jgi:hypothetical protein
MIGHYHAYARECGAEAGSDGWGAFEEVGWRNGIPSLTVGVRWGELMATWVEEDVVGAGLYGHSWCGFD